MSRLKDVFTQVIQVLKLQWIYLFKNALTTSKHAKAHEKLIDKLN